MMTPEIIDHVPADNPGARPARAAMRNYVPTPRAGAMAFCRWG